jgi:hypothetical protein
LLEHGETTRAYCILAESTVVDVSAFDEDVRMARGSAKPPQLRPEAPRVERFMKVENGLPLDDDTAPEGVIATWQPSDFDYRTEATIPSGTRERVSQRSTTIRQTSGRDRRSPMLTVCGEADPCETFDSLS